MNKFENVDIFASLDAIMRQNTGFFQSDFDIDKEIIAKAAASPNREDKTLLWFCRPSGTHCFKERDVFLKDTAAHNTWCFYKEQTCDRVLAYVFDYCVCITCPAILDANANYKIKVSNTLYFRSTT